MTPNPRGGRLGREEIEKIKWLLCREAHVHGSGCIHTYPDCEYQDPRDEAILALLADRAALEAERTEAEEDRDYWKARIDRAAVFAAGAEAGIEAAKGLVQSFVDVSAATLKRARTDDDGGAWLPMCEARANQAHDIADSLRALPLPTYPATPPAGPDAVG